MSEIKILYDLVRLNYKKFIICFTFVLLQNIWPIFPGLIIKRIFDSFHTEGDNILLLILALLFLYLLRTFIVYRSAIVDTELRFVIGSKLRNKMLKQFLELPLGNNEKKSIGYLTSTFKDDVKQVEIFISEFIDTLTSIMFFSIAFLILFSFSAVIALLSIVPIAFVILISKQTKNNILELRKHSRLSTAEVKGFIGEIVENKLLIRSFAAEKKILRQFNNNNMLRSNSMIKDEMYKEILLFSYSLISSICIALILISAINKIELGLMSVGDISLILFYYTFITHFSNSSGNLYSHFQQTKISIRRITEFVSNKELLLEHRMSDIEPKIENYTLEKFTIRNLEYKIKEKKILSNISFSISKGELVVICGEVGSGKSLLLKSIIGSINKTNGCMLWNDTIIEDPISFMVPPNCSYISQVPKLFNDTLLNNIFLGKEFDDNKISRIINYSELARDIKELEDGLNTKLGTSGGLVSGGQRQRIAVARALVHDSELLLLDDIGSALDQSTEIKLFENILQLGKSILVATNSENIIDIADRILVLDQGCLLMDGSKKELMENCDLFNKLLSKRRDI